MMETVFGVLTGTTRVSILAAVPVNFDFATASVVSFVIMLLGIAAGLLLMLRFAGERVKRMD